MPPEATTAFGVASTVLSISSSFKGTVRVKETCSDGSTKSFNIQSGKQMQRGGYRSHYNGKACKYTSDRKFGIHTYGDGDGGDSTPFVRSSQARITIQLNS